MRSLFYLPIVTPWWFDNIVAPLVRTMAGVGEVHLVVPPLYKGTGIGDRQLRRLADLQNLFCHVMDGEETHHLRMEGRDGEYALAMVEDLAPDYVFARTADRNVAQLFPGKVRFLMEARMWPLPVSERSIMLAEDMMDFGRMPELTADQEEILAGTLTPVWNRLSDLRDAEADRSEYCRAAGLPEDKKIVAVALEYEHEENAYAGHRLFRNNQSTLATLLAELPEGLHIAATNHPLNDLYVDNRAMEAFVAAHSDRITLVTERTEALNPTQLLTRHCDGLAVELSKSFAGAVFFDKPILRLSELPGGDWIRSYRSMSRFFEAVKSGTALRPDRRAGEIWFSYHLANCTVNARHANAEQLIDFVERPFNPDRWAENLSWHRELCAELREAA